MNDQGAETLQPFGESERHAEELASIHEMVSVLNAALDLDEILNTILEQVCRVLNCELGTVSLLTTDGKALRLAAAYGEDTDRLLGLEFPTTVGINAWIYNEAAPVLVVDAETDPRRLHIAGRTNAIRAAIGAPLIADGQPIGTIYLARPEPHTLTEEHLRFLTITAGQVSAAVQRARLFEEARRRAEEMESIANIGAVLASSQNVDQILQTIYEQAGRIMDTSAFFVALYDASHEQLEFELVYDHGERLSPFTVPVASGGGTSYVVQTGKPLLIRNLALETDSLPFSPMIIGEAPQSWLGVAIVFQDEVLGVISAQSYEPYAFTARQLHLLSAIANQAGIGLKNAFLFAAVQEAHRKAAEERDKLAHLHRVVAQVQKADDIPEKLHIIAQGMHELGWGRVSVSLRDADLEVVDLACVGFAPEDEAALRADLLPGREWKERLSGSLERFRIEGCYYLPWSDPWVRENIPAARRRGEPAQALDEDAWDPRDLLYVPLYGRNDRVLGLIGLDDPEDRLRPNAERLNIVQLFAREMALTLENAQLLADLRLVNTDLREMVDAQAHLLHTIDEMVTSLDLQEGIEAFNQLVGKEPSRA